MASRLAGSPRRGVTLVELLIGMLLGLISVVLISQVLLVAEGQKRTTTGGADAQVSAALAIYAVQRDVQMAGYGITSSPGVVGCPISARYNGAAPAGFAPNLAPVIITPQASRPAGSVGDSLRLLSSSKTSFSVPTRVVPPAYAVGGTGFPVRAALGFELNDLALVATDSTQPCWIFQVTAAPAACSSGACSLPRVNNAWNAANAPDVAYADGAVMMNLGTLIDSRYEIFNGTDTDGQVKNNLFRVSNFDAANPGTRVVRDVQSEIVNFRAFYGRDTSVPADGVVDVYDTTTPTTNDGWLRVRSVRVMIVSRSGTYEKDIVTTANPEWSVGAAPTTAGAITCASGGGACLAVDVGAGVAGDVPAKHYRYKVFDTVIPLRNIIWSST